MTSAAQESSSAGRPQCPRCGYDLSGALATWVDHCPVDGVCSECGLQFEFRYLLNPALSQQARFIESARAARGGLRRAFFTSARRCLRPWTFWSWVRMEDVPYPDRIGVSVAATLLFYEIGLACLWLLFYSCFVVLNALVGAYFSEDYGGIRVAVFPLAEWDYYGAYLFGVEWLGRTFAFGAFIALLMVVMPCTFLLLPQTLRKAKVKRVHLVRIAAWSSVGLVVIAHVLSAGTRNVVELVHFGLSVALNSLIVDSSLYELWRWRGPLMLTCSIAWLLMWWGFACTRYLKLDRGWLIAIVMSILGMLISFLLILTVPDLSYFFFAT